MSANIPKIALIGNPNAGKSSLFNQLTGLRQKVGNFPGVTVDRKSSIVRWENTALEIVDLPGTYSLYPTSLDERIAVSALIDTQNIDYPNAIIYIIDITQLERHLLLLTQIIDLQIPVVAALNMNDIALQQNISCDDKQLKNAFGIDFIKVNGRNGDGIDKLKSAVIALLNNNSNLGKSFTTLTDREKEIATIIQNNYPVKNQYQALLLAQNIKHIKNKNQLNNATVVQQIEAQQKTLLDIQLEDIMQRYNHFVPIVQSAMYKSYANAQKNTDKIDAIVTNKFIGPLIFFSIMFFLFQSIFAWSAIPMDWIDTQFANLATYLQNILPNNFLSRLLTEGLLPGISGILIFVPQITILFFLITLLEEIGYMARAVYLFDNIMQKFGLNGRSIVSLISGGACAIPAIMSTRTISNWKERLITILVTPFISCSARIPVYAILIGFVVPNYNIGWFNSQGLAFMALYIIGIVAALIASFAFKIILKSNNPSYLMLELPEYRKPHWKNVFFTLYEKVSSFVFGAGKIILIVSLILWFLASYGPTTKMNAAIANAQQEATQKKFDSLTTALHIASAKLEASYAGSIGQFIEPIIKPLGYDWKIGIALITSFAAREVFVGTISTLYSIGKEADNLTIKQKLVQEKKPDGSAVFTMPVALSLLLFYVFAMQCMSTLATVHRETKSWKWPILQFVFMSGTAYLVSFVVYQVLK